MGKKIISNVFFGVGNFLSIIVTDRIGFSNFLSDRSQNIRKIITYPFAQVRWSIRQSRFSVLMCFDFYVFFGQVFAQAKARCDNSYTGRGVRERDPFFHYRDTFHFFWAHPFLSYHEIANFRETMFLPPPQFSISAKKKRIK